MSGTIQGGYVPKNSKTIKNNGDTSITTKRNPSARELFDAHTEAAKTEYDTAIKGFDGDKNGKLSREEYFNYQAGLANNKGSENDWKRLSRGINTINTDDNDEISQDEIRDANGFVDGWDKGRFNEKKLDGKFTKNENILAAETLIGDRDAARAELAKVREAFKKMEKSAETTVDKNPDELGTNPFERFKNAKKDNKSVNLTGHDKPTPKEVNTAHKELAAEQHKDYLSKYDADSDKKLSAQEYSTAKIDELSEGRELSAEQKEKLGNFASKLSDAMKDKNGNIEPENLAKLNTLLDQYVDAIPDGKFTKEDEQKAYDFLNENIDNAASKLKAAGTTLDLLPNLQNLDIFKKDEIDEMTKQIEKGAEPAKKDASENNAEAEKAKQQEGIALIRDMITSDKGGKLADKAQKDYKAGKITYEKLLEKLSEISANDAAGMYDE